MDNDKNFLSLISILQLYYIDIFAMYRMFCRLNPP